MASHLVGQNQIATFITPVNGTSPIDANQVRGNDNTIKSAYNFHDLDPTLHIQDSTFAARATAGTEGRKWMTTDTGGIRLWYDTGATWEELAYLPASGGTFTGPVSFIGAVPQITLGPVIAQTVTFSVDPVDYWFTAANLSSAGPGLLPGFEFENPTFVRAQFGIDALDGTHGLEIDANNTGLINFRSLSSGRLIFESPFTVWGDESVFGDVTSGFIVSVTGAAGNVRALSFETLGVSRWAVVGASALAESGGNAGSGFAITAYTDAGVLIDAPISIVRAAAGAITFARPITASGAVTFSAAITGTSAVFSGQITATVANLSDAAPIRLAYNGNNDILMQGAASILRVMDTTGALVNLSLTQAGNLVIRGTAAITGAFSGSSTGSFAGNLNLGAQLIMGAAQRLYLDGGVDTWIYEGSTGVMNFVVDGQHGILLDNAVTLTTDLRLSVGRGGGVGFSRCSLGAADSGGAGFRVMRCPN